MKYISIIALLLLFACGSDDEVIIPEDVIPENEFVRLLTDIHLVEGAVGHIGRLEGTSVEETYGIYRAVFENHGISQEEFERSFEFYSAHMQLMNSIYEQVYDELLRKQDELKYQAPEPTVVDTSGNQLHSAPPDSVGGSQSQ